MGLIKIIPASPAEKKWTLIIGTGLFVFTSVLYINSCTNTRKITPGKGLEKTLAEMSTLALRRSGRSDAVVKDVYNYTCKKDHTMYTHKCTAEARLEDGTTAKLCIVRDFQAPRIRSASNRVTMTVTLCDGDPGIEIQEEFPFSTTFFDYSTEVEKSW